jgi:hypothetical protein
VGAVVETHQQVTGHLGRPRTPRVRDGAGHVHPTAVELDNSVQPGQAHRPTVRKSRASTPPAIAR